ncbi:endolytic transglycosylase MltG [Allosalinactinospora lopnorensis]|uniref:endolytic transglycosylase MltG n=1 Tax=Allosalinactinospora lopnorensis TaxID=1352348 RepID=UPI000623D334|nr:endolytic transglycosylase MltG [Allosalinactinospora lopnorensis]
MSDNDPYADHPHRGGFRTRRGQSVPGDEYGREPHAAGYPGQEHAPPGAEYGRPEPGSGHDPLTDPRPRGGAPRSGDSDPLTDPRWSTSQQYSARSRDHQEYTAPRTRLSREERDPLTDPWPRSTGSRDTTPAPGDSGQWDRRAEPGDSGTPVRPYTVGRSGSAPGVERGGARTVGEEELLERSRGRRRRNGPAQEDDVPGERDAGGDRSTRRTADRSSVEPSEQDPALPRRRRRRAAEEHAPGGVHGPEGDFSDPAEPDAPASARAARGDDEKAPRRRRRRADRDDAVPLGDSGDEEPAEEHEAFLLSEDSEEEEGGVDDRARTRKAQGRKERRRGGRTSRKESASSARRGSSGAKKGARGSKERKLRRTKMAMAATAGVLALALVAGGIVLRSYVFPPDYDGEGSGEVEIAIQDGQTGAEVGQTLEDEGVVASRRAFTNALSGAELTPGTYMLRSQMSADTAVAMLLDPATRVDNRVTIREGLRSSQILQEVAENTAIELEDLQEAYQDTGSLALPGYAEEGPEGYLYPDTYTIAPDAQAEDVLKMMVDRFYDAAEEINLEGRAQEQGMTPNEIMANAAIIQAESGGVDDMPKISRVVYNRLNADMELGMDSTCFYELNEYGIALTNDQLRKCEENDSGYATYGSKGLPVGPFVSPGQDAIEAALEPADGDWLYFVATDPEAGITEFAETNEEFQQLKQEFERNRSDS